MEKKQLAKGTTKTLTTTSYSCTKQFKLLSPSSSNYCTTSNDPTGYKPRFTCRYCCCSSWYTDYNTTANVTGQGQLVADPNTANWSNAALGKLQCCLLLLQHNTQQVQLEQQHCYTGRSYASLQLSASMAQCANCYTANAAQGAMHT